MLHVETPLIKSLIRYDRRRISEIRLLGDTPLSDPPPAEASSQVKMAYKLRPALGKAIYGARTCTVEPVIGIIKEVLGFRQFSLRGELAAAGEWCLVCLAFNLKRFHTVFWA